MSQQRIITAPTITSDERVFNQEGAALDLNKILVVDDTPLNLEFMKVVFGYGEFTLSVANNGEEGWAKACTEAPFLILTDIQMPGMSGLKLCKKIKADPRTKNAAVIFITAYGQYSSLVSKGLNMGADDFISRPLDKDELLARVRAVARLKRAELEAQRQAQIVAQHNKSLELLNELAVAITSSLDLQQIFISAMQRLSELLKAEAVAIVLLDQKTQDLIVNIGSRAGEYISLPVSISARPEITELTLQEQVPVTISNILNNRQFNQAIDPPSGLEAIVCVPMVTQEQTIGAIAIINKEGGLSKPEDWALLNSAVNIITVAVQNARLFAKVQAFNRDLERMVAERTRELDDEKKKVEAILVSMADGVLVLDDEGRISTVNTAAQEILGTELNELLGLPIESSQLTNPLWTVIRKLTSSSELMANTSIDMPNPTNPDSLLSVQANSATVRTETGHTIGTVIVLSDVTAIVEVERMKARFMAGVTHELKTPLAIIKLHSNNLATYHDRLPEKKRTQILTAIKEQIKLLEQLVEDILELSRFDASISKIKREPTNLVQLIDKIITEVRPLTAEKGLTLNWNPRQPDIIIQADANKVDWLVGNLVDNAIKYSLVNGSVAVTITTERQDERRVAIIQVIDTGVGIAPEEQSRIFERFYRVDSSHTIPGTGLGLSIVKEIANAHGGQVTLESRLGVGSTFRVTLPDT